MPSTTRRRRFVRVSGTVVVGLAGCVSARDRDGRGATKTGPPTTGGADPDSVKDHDVYLDNRHDEEHTVLLRITHEGATVHEERYGAPLGTDTVIYNFRRSPVPGEASYDVVAELEDGQTDGVAFRTDSCHGSVVVSVDEDGTLGVIYSVC